jgi:hypothetical protein
MTFKLKPNHGQGSSLKGYAVLVPSKLVAVFGKPGDSDSYKVSGQYRFETPNGGLITLYDWKSTSLYDPDYPDPEEIWSSDKPFEFNVGGDSDGKAQFEEFLLWIEAQLSNSVNFIKED